MLLLEIAARVDRFQVDRAVGAHDKGDSVGVAVKSDDIDLLVGAMGMGDEIENAALLDLDGGILEGEATLRLEQGDLFVASINHWTIAAHCMHRVHAT